MRQAFLVRPQWRDGPRPDVVDPRIVPAPVQELVPCDLPASLAASLMQSTSPWLVFTSPASVQAFDRWVTANGLRLVREPWVRVAAVGSGTRDALERCVAAHAADASKAWALVMDKVVISESDEKADAGSLLLALDSEQHRAPLDWTAQALMLVQGQDNRPTLAAGLRARGARVIEAPLYQRVNVDWAPPIWRTLAQQPWSESGVVVTSSTVVDRLMAMMRDHDVPAAQLIWCTQHQTIADRLKAAGVPRVRRVRLDAQHLGSDLFEHEHNW